MISSILIVYVYVYVVRDTVDAHTCCEIARMILFPCDLIGPLMTRALLIILIRYNIRFLRKVI